MKRLLSILLLLLVFIPNVYSQDVVTPFLIVLNWLKADSVYTRALTVSGTLTTDVVSADSGNYRELTVTDSAFVDTLTANVLRVTGKAFVEDSLRVEETALIKGDVTLNEDLFIDDSLDVDGVLMVSPVRDQVGIGITPISKLTIGTLSTSSPRGIVCRQTSADALASSLSLRKSRGTAHASPATIVTGDTLGTVNFWGYEGTNWKRSGQIASVSSGTIGTTRVPSKLVFSTSTDAAPSVLTERMSITNAGVTNMEGSVVINSTVVDQENPSVTINADLDQDGGETSSGVGKFVFTQASTPGGAVFDITATNGKFRFMDNGGGNGFRVAATNADATFGYNTTAYYGYFKAQASSPLEIQSGTGSTNLSTIYIDIGAYSGGADGEIRLGDTGTAGEYSRIDSNGVFYSPSDAVKIADVITSNSVTQYVKVVSLADGAQHILPTGKAGFGKVSCNGEFATFYFTAAGAVSLVTAGTAGLTSANVTTTEDNDTTLNIFDDGDGIGIENELGGTYNVMIDITYYTP